MLCVCDVDEISQTCAGIWNIGRPEDPALTKGNDEEVVWIAAAHVVILRLLAAPLRCTCLSAPTGHTVLASQNFHLDRQDTRPVE